MSLIKEYEEKYNTGFPTFEKLFWLNKHQLVNLLKQVCNDHSKVIELLESNPNCYKKLTNDIPEEVTLSYWSTIKIIPTGIQFKTEHGQFEDVVSFNRFFYIPEEVFNENLG